MNEGAGELRVSKTLFYLTEIFPDFQSDKYSVRARRCVANAHIVLKKIIMVEKERKDI